MVFFFLKLIGFFKEESDFVSFTVFVLYCLIVTKLLFELVSYLFGKLKVALLSFSFIWTYFDFVNKFY